MNRTNSRRVLTCAVLTALAGAAVFAGPLNPPAGPVASTYKTLTDVEPRIAVNATNTPGSSNSVFEITQPGSYYLTGNVTVPGGMNGIVIAASNVTLDLNGYTVSGLANSMVGITTNAFVPSNTVIKNGAVSNCGDDGVNLAGCPFARVTDVAVSGNHGYGIIVGSNAVIRGCTASGQTQAGFYSAAQCRFDHCTSFGNLTGFSSVGNDVFESCVANANTGVGFSVGGSTRVSHCTAASNALQGIVCGNTNVISGCHVTNNGSGTAAGIWVQGTSNLIERNDLIGNGYGLYVNGTSNFICGNKVGGSPQSNFYIVMGNHVGTIGVPTTTPAVINGNSGGGLGVLESDPNANLIY